MKKTLLGLLLTVLVLGCDRTPIDVSFASDPRILRGQWTGSLEKICSKRVNSSQLNPTATQALVGYYGDSNTAYRLFDTQTGSQLGSFDLGTVISPFVWNDDNTKIVYYRLQGISSAQNFVRVELNTATGFLTAVSTPTSFTNQYSSNTFNAALTRMAKVTSVNGTNQLTVYDLSSGTIVQTVTGVSSGIPQFSPDGTKLAYSTLSASNLVQIQLLDLTTGVSQKLLEADFSLRELGFSGNTILNIVAAKNALFVQRLELQTLTSTIIELPNTYATKISASGNQIAYSTTNNTVGVKDLVTGAIILEKPLGIQEAADFLQLGNPQLLEVAFDGTSILVGSEKTWQCIPRILRPSTQQDLVVEAADSQVVTLNLVATYTNDRGYAVAGTAQIGSSAAKAIDGEARVGNGCQYLTFGYCERLTPALSPMPLWMQTYPDFHYVDLRYTDGTDFPISISAIGTNQKTKKVQLFVPFYRDTSKPFAFLSRMP
jgi:hypothetical protein